MAVQSTSTVSGFRTLASQPPLEKETCWLQVVSHLSPQYGGIAASVPHLAKATEEASSHSCPIVGFCDASELAQVPEDQREAMKIFTPDRMRWIFDRDLRQKMKTTVQAATGVHIHGVWETHCMITSGIARECKRPYMISVHGMLEQWALRNKRIKKALYAALVEIRRMQRASCLRALSVDEVGDYRRLGLTNPIAIIPNGIDTPPLVSPDVFRRSYPELADKRIILFLGRLHKKKGVELLLEAWSRLAAKTENVHLVIAGPDADMLSALQTMTDELKLRPYVTFTGMLGAEQKWSALAAASLFVLPSYSEGFSVAVLEALASGVPVIVTTECHIPEVVAHNCGWAIRPEVNPLEQALTEFLQLSAGDASEMSARGRALVNSQFHSSVVGAQIAQVYDWLQGGGKPATVEIV